MAESEEEVMGFPVICHIVAGWNYIRQQQTYFFFILYIVQLYKEDCAILQICGTVGP